MALQLDHDSSRVITESTSNSLKIEIVSRQELEFMSSERIKVTLADGAITLITVVRQKPGAVFDLKIDERFIDNGIALGSRYLIDQAKTKEQWGGESVGKLPQEFSTSDVETVVFDPSNAGWQTGAFWIKDGRPILIKNDQHSLNGNFSVLGYDGSRWISREITFVEGQLIQEDSLNDLALGFSLPLIVKNGQPVPLTELMDDARILADLRNVFNFGPAKGLPSQFWEILRKLLPQTGSAARRLKQNRPVVQRAHAIFWAKMKEKAASIMNWLLTRNLHKFLKLLQTHH